MKQTALLADIGGTNVRFGLLRDKEIFAAHLYKCADYHSLPQAAKAYLKEVAPEAGEEIKLSSGVFSVAGPVSGDRFKLTNFTWSFSVADVQDKLGLGSLDLINDFHAIALAIPRIKYESFESFGGQETIEVDGYPKVVIGPGTGLGVAALIWDGKRYIAVPGEGGHVSVAAQTRREFEVIQWLRAEKYSHVSTERVCSGKGLVNLYEALYHVDGKPLETLPEPEDITQAVRLGDDLLARESWQMMTGFLGSLAGNLCLTLNARGGIYLAGGVALSSSDIFDKTLFRKKMEAKGRYADFLKTIPAYLVTEKIPAFTGLQAYLESKTGR